MATHEPIEMVWHRRGNKKHTHNTRRGIRNFNHWFNVYKCPTCDRCTSHKRLPIICRGEELTGTVNDVRRAAALLKEPS